MDAARSRPLIRLVGVATGALVAAVAALLVWLGGGIVAVALTGGVEHRGLVLGASISGGGLLFLAAMAAWAAWLGVTAPYRPRHPLVRVVFALPTFALPAIVGYIAGAAADPSRLFGAVPVLTASTATLLVLLLVRGAMTAR